MPSPFPGMDPYLESRYVWPDFHSRLIVAMGDALAPQVEPAYYVAVEQRAYVVTADTDPNVIVPDAAVIVDPAAAGPRGGGGVATVIATATQTVTLPRFEEIRESCLEVREVQSHAVITAIELLSPSNKATADGRREYEAKRKQVLTTATNLVEIDLLRLGEPMAMTPTPETDYRIVVSRWWERPAAQLHAFGIRQPLPSVAIPLRDGEQEAILLLGQLLAELYDRARYHRRLDYTSTPPEPSFSPDEATWIDALLIEKGVRPPKPPQ